MRSFLKRALVPLALAAAIVVPTTALATNNDIGQCSNSMPPSNDYLYCGIFPNIGPGFNMRGTHSWSSFSFEVYFRDGNNNYLGPYGPWTRTGVNYSTYNITPPAWSYGVRALVKNSTSSVDQMKAGWHS